MQMAKGAHTFARLMDLPCHRINDRLSDGWICLQPRRRQEFTPHRLWQQQAMDVREQRCPHSLTTQIAHVCKRTGDWPDARGRAMRTSRHGVICRWNFFHARTMRIGQSPHCPSEVFAAIHRSGTSRHLRTNSATILDWIPRSE